MDPEIRLCLIPDLISLAFILRGPSSPCPLNSFRGRGTLRFLGDRNPKMPILPKTLLLQGSARLVMGSNFNENNNFKKQQPPPKKATQ